MNSPSTELVSIVVPVYNAEKFLPDTIESILNQTYNNWELLLIDDGSKDKSISVINEYAKKDTRIRLLRHNNNKNKGVSATRNLGLKSSLGKYIALIDSDDLWYPEKLAKQVSILDKLPSVGIVYCQLLTQFDSPNPSFPKICGTGKEGLNDDAFELMVYDKLWMPNSSVLFRKDLLKKVTGFNEHLRYQIEDHLLFTKIAYHSQCYYLAEILGVYRMHGSSYTFTTQWKVSHYEFLIHLLLSKNTGKKLFIMKSLIKRLLKK